MSWQNSGKKQKNKESHTGSSPKDSKLAEEAARVREDSVRELSKSKWDAV